MDEVKRITAGDIIYNDDRLNRIQLARELYNLGMKCTDYIIQLSEKRYSYNNIPSLSIDYIGKGLAIIENKELSDKMDKILENQSTYLYQSLKDIHDNLKEIRQKLLLSEFAYGDICNQIVGELNKIFGVYCTYKKRNTYSYNEQLHNILTGYALFHSRIHAIDNIRKENIDKSLKTLYGNIRNICSDIIEEIVIIEDVNRRF